MNHRRLLETVSRDVSSPSRRLSLFGLGGLALAAATGVDRHDVAVVLGSGWKPAADPYQHAAGELGREPHRLALVAAHPWDCAGANAAGLRSGWVNRTGDAWPRVFPAADVSGADLTVVVTGLLAAR